MKRTLFKNIFSAIVVSFLMMATVFITASAATPEELVDKVIHERILELEEQFGNEYFTVNQKGCYSYFEKTHGCANCFNLNVVKQDWFKNKVSKLSWVKDNFDYNELKPSTLYGGYYAYYPNGNSCHGAASVFFTLLFSDIDEGDNISVYKVGTYEYSFSAIRDVVKIGDWARLNESHSVVILKATEEGLEVFDNNYGGSQNCLSRTHIIPFSAYSYVTITRAANRANVHTCSYNSAGKCNCGAEYNFNEHKNYSYKGDYYRKTVVGNSIALRAKPYSAAPVVARISKDNITVLWGVSNHYGNIWLAVSYESANTCEIGYIYSDTLLKNYKKNSSVSSSAAHLQISNPNQVICYGSRGKHVTQLQKALNYIMQTELNIDGAFGRHTESTVRDFQSAYGLVPDGIAGPMTLNKINSLLS